MSVLKKSSPMGNLERFNSSVERILSLKDGWQDGTGKKFSAAKVRRLQKIMRNLLDEDLLPSIFPTTEGKKGTIDAEWAFRRKDKGRAVILSVSMEDMSASAFFIDLNRRVGEECREETTRDIGDGVFLEKLKRGLEDLRRLK